MPCYAEAQRSLQNMHHYGLECYIRLVFAPESKWALFSRPE